MLCEPILLAEPTITFEDGGAVFEAILRSTCDAGSAGGCVAGGHHEPFSDDNDIELESELKLFWLESEQTGGWLSSHFDIVDKLSPAERPTDTRAYTHKLNFELDTAVAPFIRLREDSWLRDVEIEGSLDYVATGLPRDTPRWSFSLVFVVPSQKAAR